MRLTFKFVAEGPVVLPLNYNQHIQALIYRYLDESLAEFLHNEGYRYEKRRFKLFTFSRVLGRFRLVEEGLMVKPPFRIVVSSPLDDILRSLAENMVREGEFAIAENRVFLEAVNVHFTPPIGEEISIRMLSPVTVYSTLMGMDGGKKTYYYTPLEDEFGELIKRNLIKKYSAMYGKGPASEAFSIEPLRVRKTDEKIIKYKGFIIKGWMGRFRLKGSPELLRLAYESGIGSKNSQGFGCFEILPKQSETSSERSNS